MSLKNIRKLPSDLLRCKGKQTNECMDCARRLSPAHDFQSYVRVWQGHGPCPDKLTMQQAQAKYYGTAESL